MPMQEQPDTPVQNSEPAPAKPIRHLELKAALLLIFTALLVAGSAFYLLYARGFFEPTQTLVLLTEDSEGVVVGMDMTFSGFPIGRVRRVELAETGNVRIVIDVPKKDAHWLRTSSVFTLVRGLVGGTNIRAFSGILTDPPLPDGAERPALRGDATAELPRVLATAKEVLENLSAMTAEDAALRASLADLQHVTQRLKGPRGALGVVFGNDADAGKLIAALDRTNALLARVDSLAAKADAQVFGPEGVMRDARATVAQLNNLLSDTRASLKGVDAVLAEAQGIGANVRGATSDLGTLRAEVEANLRKIEGMINELNRKWPFARETEVKLP
jgi:phospholipid/cholesterol/gamma-HCH transport system substrate-binding protein